MWVCQSGCRCRWCWRVSRAASGRARVVGVDVDVRSCVRCACVAQRVLRAVHLVVERPMLLLLPPQLSWLGRVLLGALPLVLRAMQSGRATCSDDPGKKDSHINILLSQAGKYRCTKANTKPKLTLSKRSSASRSSSCNFTNEWSASN